MCGRYTIYDEATDLEYLSEYFGLQKVAVDKIPARYNASPSQSLPVIFENHRTGDRILNAFRWGLIPSWAKDINIGYKMINARSESLSEKTSYKGPFKHQRCLIPASGFYEWDKTKEKMPHYFKLKDSPIMSFAGLYERWKSPNGDIWSYTIITTDANDLVAKTHPRMPAIIHPKEFDFWLDPDNQNTEELSGFLKPYPANEFETWTVSRELNKPVNDYKGLLERV
ncbi:MAG TPA: SOS response-associated peptidase [Bacteroidales bacterium]|nr:SOS response-associated peptidase [Bacteroidales bacterium]